MPLDELIKQSGELSVDEQEALAHVILKRTKTHRAQDENFYCKTFKFVISVSTALTIVYAVFSIFIGDKMRTIMDTLFFYIFDNSREIFVTTVSLFVLAMLTYIAIKDIKSMTKEADGINRKKANSIAVFISSLLTLFLFQQPFLDRIFGETDAGTVMNSILFGGGAFTGWVIWYLRKLEKYGEFFHILLLGCSVGLAWYARMSAPEEVQLTTLAFILASLTRIAFDYMELETKNTARSARSDKNVN